MSIQIASLYPDAARDFEQGLNKCSLILDQNYRQAKYKICQFVELTSRTTHLDNPIREELLDVVVQEDLQGATHFLDVIPQGGGSSAKTALYQWTTSLVSRFTSKGRDEDADLAMMQEAIRDTPKAARNISDSQFLSQIVKSEIVQSSVLKPVAEEAQEIAMTYLRSTISHLVKAITSSTRLRKEEQYIAQITAELSSYEDGEQRRQRSHFIHQINNASNQDGDM